MISINAKIGSHNKHSQPSQRLKFIYFIPCFSYSAAILIPFQKENPFITASVCNKQSCNSWQFKSCRGFSILFEILERKNLNNPKINVSHENGFVCIPCFSYFAAILFAYQI